MEKVAIITLIHGTFARHANWTTETSSFRKSLSGHFEGDVRFERFEWSGRNNLNDRQRAADELALVLEQQRKRHQNLSQILVGHSHGGSVLAYLLIRYPAVAANIAGAAFLATPFMAAKPRQDWPQIAAVTALAFLLCFSATATGGLFRAWRAALDAGYFTLTDVLSFVTFVFIFAPLFLAMAVSPSAIAMRYDIRQLAQSLSTSDLPEGQYLFVKATGDEAASALWTAQFFSWLFSRFVSVVVRPLFTFETSPFLIAFLLLCAFTFVPLTGGIAVIGMGLSVPWEFAEDFSTFTWYNWLFPGSILWVGLSLSVLAFAFSVFWIICCIVCWLGHLSFGWASFKTAMFIDLAVEAVPVGAHVLVHTPWLDVGVRDLSHSSPYQNADAIRILSDWLEAVLRERKRTSDHDSNEYTP
jgi:pimeloyl-ACP methyl ester carboxylesterase